MEQVYMYVHPVGVPIESSQVFHFSATLSSFRGCTWHHSQQNVQHRKGPTKQLLLVIFSLQDARLAFSALSTHYWPRPPNSSA